MHVFRFLNRTCGAVLKTLIPTSLAYPPHVGAQKLLLKLCFNDQHYGYSLKFWHPISLTHYLLALPFQIFPVSFPCFSDLQFLPSKQGLSTVRVRVKVAQVLFAQIYGLLANNNDVIKTGEFSFQMSWQKTSSVPFFLLTQFKI